MYVPLHRTPRAPARSTYRLDSLQPAVSSMRILEEMALPRSVSDHYRQLGYSSSDLHVPRRLLSMAIEWNPSYPCANKGTFWAVVVALGLLCFPESCTRVCLCVAHPYSSFGSRWWLQCPLLIAKFSEASHLPKKLSVDVPAKQAARESETNNHPEVKVHFFSIFQTQRSTWLNSVYHLHPHLSKLLHFW